MMLKPVPTSTMLLKASISEIDETLKENVFYTKLEEMLNFSRFEFDFKRFFERKKDKN